MRPAHRAVAILRGISVVESAENDHFHFVYHLYLNVVLNLTKQKERNKEEEER